MTKLDRVSSTFDTLGLVRELKKPVARVGELQDRSIKATYGVVRGVGREVDHLLRERPARGRQRLRPRRSQRYEVKSVARAVPAARSVRPAEPAARPAGLRLALPRKAAC